MQELIVRLLLSLSREAAAAVQFSACSPVELPRESESAPNICSRMLVLSLLQERASKSDESVMTP